MTVITASLSVAEMRAVDVFAAIEEFVGSPVVAASAAVGTFSAACGLMPATVAIASCVEHAVVSVPFPSNLASEMDDPRIAAVAKPAAAAAMNVADAYAESASS